MAPGTWLVGLIQFGDNFISLLVDSQYRDNRPPFSYLVVTRVSIAHPNPSGMRDVTESALPKSIESDLEAIADSAFVGTSTGAGERVYFLYSADAGWVERFETTLTKRSAPRDASCRATQDPDWRMYRSLVAEAAAADADRRVVTGLSASGASLDQPRQIDWTLLFDQGEHARSAEANLRGMGFEVSVTRSETGPWLVEASSVAVVSLSYVAQMSAAMKTLATNLNGTYDGWGAGIEHVN